VDVLVNNAGVFVAKPTADYDVDDVEQMIGTNLKGFVYPSQQAARHMAEPCLPGSPPCVRGRRNT
jgi:NADP-dependent 3-hydroxy acid dehydrogenase YdfG